MARKIRKKEIDQQLLETIFRLEKEWKQVQSIVRRSIEPTIQGQVQQAIAEAKYMFLLREARHRKLSAQIY